MIGSRIFQEISVTGFCATTFPQNPILSGFFGLNTFPFPGVYDWVSWQEAAMHTPMHWRTERGRYFQAHPLHATFSLITSMLLAGLVVLVLVLSAK